ncbi:hypothetical protein GCM10028789_29270 [Sinomonas halotolerans]
MRPLGFVDVVGCDVRAKREGPEDAVRHERSFLFVESIPVNVYGDIYRERSRNLCQGSLLKNFRALPDRD